MSASITDPLRRRLIQAGLAASASALLPPSIARAAAIAPDVRSGTLEDLRHVVILMQENRAFDHYFGTLAGVRGFGDRFVAPAPPVPELGLSQRTVWLQPSAEGDRIIMPFALDTAEQFGYMRVQGTPHTWPNAQRAWDHGRLGRWPEAKRNHSLGYYRRADLPFQFALAETFTICDAYHCSIQAGTNPNRVFLWCGHNDPHARGGGPVIANSHDNFAERGGHPASYTWSSYVEHLQNAGVDWRIYQDMDDNFTDNPLAGFELFRRAWRGDPGHDPQLRQRALSSYSLQQLRRDVLQGTLPQVSFIIADAAGSEHPDPSSPAQGAAYTARVLDALTADPAVWSRTALLLMFDENDGFFDHVPPPAPPSPDPGASGGFAGASTVPTDGEYHHQPAPADAAADDPELRGRPYGLGPRVPMYLISPWSRGGWVDSRVYDHTSVLRLLERRFGVAAPELSPWRRAVCGDLSEAFDFARSDVRPFLTSLPATAETAARAAALAEHTLPHVPELLSPPRQEAGVRRARALPYRPHAALRIDQDPTRVHLQLGCEGAAAVLHVYDRLHPDAIPRRYTLTPGHPLQASWASDPQRRYDLWLLGPNGFHRHWRGRSDLVPVQATLRREAAQLRLRLHNPASVSVALQLRAGAYPQAMPARRLTLPPGQTQEIAWEASATAGWYDLWIEQDAAQQRLAGRAEDGQPGISDPAMAGAACLQPA